MRLTEKSKFPIIDEIGYFLDFEKDGYAIATKLGQLEDIEEELGVELITLFKALNNGIWTNYDRRYLENEGKLRYIEPGDFAIMFIDYPFCVLTDVIYYGGTDGDDFARSIDADFGDTLQLNNTYGKTWALTKEELM